MRPPQSREEPTWGERPQRIRGRWQGSHGSVAELGSAHGDGERRGHRVWAAGRDGVWGHPTAGATPHSPPQPRKAALRVQVRVCRALFITQQAGTAQGAGGCRRRGMSCPSCDLWVGTGTVVRTRAEAAGAEAKPAASPAHDLFPVLRAQPKQLLPVCNAALAKPLPSPVPVPIPVGNTWHPYLQSKTELTDITNN